MTDLDTRLRTGLAASAERIVTPDTDALAARLGSPRRRRPVRWLAAAAVLVVVAAVVVAIAGQDGEEDGQGVVATAPSSTAAPTGSFGDAFAAGWDELGTGMVVADQGAGLAWTGHDLVAVTGIGLAYALDPEEHTWRELDPVPWRGYHVAAAWTGSEVVVVVEGAGAPRSAAWDPATEAWREHGEVPIAPELAAATGATSTWPTQLVWTGERVIDPTRMAALDPVSGVWTTMPLPADLVTYSNLLYGGMVWDGEEAVMVAWRGDGLAWDATGSEYRIVPGSPPEVSGDPDSLPSSRVVTVDGEVIVVAGLEGTGGAAALDARTDTWRRLPDVPGVGDEIGCPYGVAVVGGRPVVMRCDGEDVVVLGDDGWEDTGAPTEALGCCIGEWVSTGDALVVWSSDTDTHNNPDAPYVRAWTWVPPG